VVLRRVPAAINKKSRIARTLLILAYFLLVSAGRIAALDPGHRISQYGHSSWKIQDGYFGSQPVSITQTTDGYLWVETEGGIFRFDGVQFVSWTSLTGEKLPSNDYWPMLGARDGSLYIGTDSGLLRWANQLLTRYLDGETVGGIMQDEKGQIWFTHYRPGNYSDPLCRISGTDVRCYDYGTVERGLLSAPGHLAEDASGSFWVILSTAVVRWKPGSVKIYRLTYQGGNGVRDLAAADDGSVWIGIETPGHGGGLQRIVGGVMQPFAVPKLNGETLEVFTLLIDRQGSLWVGTLNQGLYRIHGADVDHFGSANGLSSDSVNHLFEDREGSLWVATSKGLDMLRDLPMSTFSTSEGVSEDEVESVLAARDGTVWIGSNHLQALESNGISPELGKRLPGNYVTSLLEDHTGRLWVGTDHALWTREGGKNNGMFRQIRKADGSAMGMVWGLTEDSEHNIWVSAYKSLIRIRDLTVREEFPQPPIAFAQKLAPDPQSGIWLGLLSGNLARFRSGKTEIFTFPNHPNTPVKALFAASDGSILGATEFGVVAWKSGKQQVLSARNGLPCDDVNMLNSDDQSDLWLYSACGLIEVPREEIQRWWREPEAKLKMRVFDALDGVQAGLSHFSGSSKAPDGRLWFANNSVVQTIDPAHLTGNTVPPPVHITGILADRKSYPLLEAPKLPALTRDLEIDYTAPSLSVPKKVLFRYMLEGHDAGWQEPGTRRQAFYNDLRPRHYRFRVIACNNDGVWNETGAFLDFSVAPAYYQTSWFSMSCAAGFLALLWGIYRLRVQQLQHQFAIGLEARVNERTRIARELHDTLLQSLQGLMLHFQTGIDLLPGRPAEARKALEIAVDRADQTINEGRDAVQGLRASAVETNDLVSAVRILGEELGAADKNQNSAVFEVEVKGAPRNLHPILRDEVYRIAAEALRNAFHHAHAQRIEVEILYGERWLRLRVRDDGKGIDPKFLSGDGREKHYGLRGMRERAELVGGKLAVWSKLDSGAEVELSIPASTAYATSYRRRSWLSEKLSGRGTNGKATDVKETKIKS
jgi:signal transduction histidine kinase/ligand-binding sensor domain-containing protein